MWKHRVGRNANTTGGPQEKERDREETGGQQGGKEKERTEGTEKREKQRTENREERKREERTEQRRVKEIVGDRMTHVFG